MNILLKICCIALLTFVTSAQAAEFVDGPRVKNLLNEQVKKMFDQKKYADLDAMADSFLSNKSRFPDGGWKLYTFFLSFHHDSNQPDWVYTKYIDLAQEWRTTRPKSVSAQIVLAQAWLDFAWKARGIRYAREVREDAWPIVNKRLDTAWNIVNEPLAPGVVDNPERHTLRLYLANVRGVERKEFETLFQEAIRLYPKYYPIYYKKAEYLSPRWHGEEGEWQQFIADVAKKNPEGLGATIYTRTAWVWFYEWMKFENSGISWDTMRTGFMEIDRMFPNSPFVINGFASFACLAKDQKTLTDLLKRIDNHYYPEAWLCNTSIAYCRNFAGL